MITEEKTKEIKEAVEQILKDEHIFLLRKGERIRLKAWGFSMYPFIKDQDTIEVTPINEGSIKIGDIISVDNQERARAWFYVHRVVKVFTLNDKKIFVTKGDSAKKGFDNPVGFERIAGKVAQIERGNLRINMEKPLWKYANKYIALFSLKAPTVLCKLAPYISLLVEWKWFPSKIMKRVRGMRTATESSKLKMSYLYATAKAALQERETIALLKLFSDKNIPAIPLKGPLLSKRLYGDIAARGVSIDIDLLIEKKNREKAGELLKKIGYTFNSRGAKDIGKLWQHLYMKKENTSVDLHWDIMPFTFFEDRMEEFWKGARLAREGDISFYELEEEELLIYIAANFVDSGRLIELRYLFDINEILKKHKDALNWANIINKAKRWRVASSLYTALSLSRNLIGSYIPAETVAELKPPFIKRVLIRTFANKRVLLCKDSKRRRFLERFLRYIFPQLLEARSLKEHFQIIFPPKERMGKKTYFRRLANSTVRFVKAFR